MTEAEIGGIYRRNIAMVRRCARRIVLNEATAEDIAQETFLKYLKYRRRDESERDTAALLYRIAVNLALTFIRTSKRRQGLLEREHRAEVRNPGSVEDRLDLQEVLTKVGAEEAQIATCYYVEGMEQEEIAEVFSLQRRTVGRRLDAFREAARRLLADRTRNGVAT